MIKTFLIIIQIIGICIPLTGVAALLRQEQNKVSTYLMLTNIGCLIMNVGQLLLLNCETYEAAMLAYKVGYFGSTWFYFCFGLFVTSYLSKFTTKWLFVVWGAIEAASVLALYIEPLNPLLLRISYNEPSVFSFIQTIQIIPGPLYLIRYCAIAFVLFIAMGMTLYRMFKMKNKREKYKLARLEGAEFVILSALILMLTWNLKYDIVPIAASAAIITIILSVVRGEFFGIAEWGREWAFEQMGEAVVIVDNTYNFLDANSYAKTILPELKNQNANTQISERILGIFENERDEEEIADQCYEKKVMAITQNGQTVGYSLLMVDITKQKQLMNRLEEEKNRADEANQAKSAFMSNMSHEIRTPMNAIVGMTEILLRSDLPSQETEYLHNIKNSGNALLTIINDILDFSKIESGKMDIVSEEYDPMSMFSDLSMIFLNRIGDKDIELIFDIDKNLPVRLYGDSLRIRQIIINLMNNAVKFTDVGTVKLAVSVEKIKGEEVGLLFSVTDTGQGIMEEDLPKLFGTYQQVDTKKNRYKEGTGLGLSISKQLVEMMGGTIGVRSEYEKGSEFYFTLTQKVVDARSIEEMGQSLTGKKTAFITEGEEALNFIAPKANILIVDDNQMNLKVALGLLEPLQMQMHTAENGRQALAMLEKKQYDLVFMDHMMPVMDGIEAVEALRKKNDEYYQKLPVIALTANAVVEARERFKEAGMNDFLSKPIKIKEICNVLRKWLPAEYIIETEPVTVKRQEELPEITGLDVAEGVKNSGSVELFTSLLGDFYKLIDMKSVKIEKCLADGLIRDYTIEVHALKNTARMIGAMELSELFYQMEQYGNEENVEAIRIETPRVLELYRSYKSILEPYARLQNVEKQAVTKDELIRVLTELQEAMDAFDLDTVDARMQQLEQMSMPPECDGLFDELRAYVADVAMEEVMKVAGQLIQMIQKKQEE